MYVFKKWKKLQDVVKTSLDIRNTPHRSLELLHYATQRHNSSVKNVSDMSKLSVFGSLDVTGNKYKENEDRLELSISTIKEKLDLLQANFTHLQNQSSALNESYSELLSQNDELKTNHSELLSRYSSLYENFTELTLRFTALDDYCPIANNITNERKCAVCPKDWLLFNKMCYLFSTVTKTWNKSRDYCASLKGHLVIIENAEEQRFLINTTKSKEGPYWIGLTDQEIEGHFVWVNNGSLDGNNR
ncbi:CLC4M protein, partial [Polypterus senegalus]